MANSNNENPIIGQQFQASVNRIMSAHFGQRFDDEVRIPIGNPPKDHKFDCVSEDRRIVVESKCYTWTDTGKIPSAKMATLNETVFFMSFLPSTTIKIIALKKAVHPLRNETLGEYYCRIYNHLLRDVKIFEIDDNNEIRIINDSDKANIFVTKTFERPSAGINYLWWNGSYDDWKNALNYYWSFLRPENKSIELEIENLNTEKIKKMSVYEFYDFLHDKYFVWKYTAKNRLATSRAHLEKYINDACLEELGRIHYSLMTFDLNDIRRGLEIAYRIKGLGTAGASGLLAVMFPKWFGTVDQFVVKSLCSIDNLSENRRLMRMNSDDLNIGDGEILIDIMRRKAKELNEKFNTNSFKPRDIDKVLWSIGR
jgi:hypothetical protein